MGVGGKVCSGGDGLAAYQLVGGVMAYQRLTGSRPERVTGHVGRDTAQTPTGGSSGEYCTMGESLMQRRRVRDGGLRVVKPLSLMVKPATVGCGEGSG